MLPLWADGVNTILSNRPRRSIDAKGERSSPASPNLIIDSHKVLAKLGFYGAAAEIGDKEISHVFESGKSVRVIC
jgi:hypothetical protein